MGLKLVMKRMALWIPPGRRGGARVYDTLNKPFQTFLVFYCFNNKAD